jgi:asparaginyl-tRNA synthetase
MKDKSDKKTTASFDLILPQIGELVGGSMRETNLKTLQTKAKKNGINAKNLT